MKQKSITQTLKRCLCMGLSAAMAFTMMPETQARAEDGNPARAGSVGLTADATTRSQPFERGTGSSTSFGSPSLIVRQVEKNAAGSKPTSGITTDLIVAAAEARYGERSSTPGQDIIISTSEDGGANWSYGYPLKFEDSQGAAEGAVSISNPVLVDNETTTNDFVTGGTTYLLVNVAPGTVSNDAGLKSGSGYYSVGEGSSAVLRLALTNDSSKVSNNPVENTADYPFYVGEMNNGYAPILKKSDNSDTNDAVDAYFNLYTRTGADAAYTPLTQKQIGSNTDVQQNIFYAASKYHVYNANYIVCMMSSDKGATWSTPEILNADILRNEQESVSLSVGKGLKTSLNRLVVPITSRTNPADQTTSKAAMIWKDVDPNRLAGEPEPKWNRSIEDVVLPEAGGEAEGEEKEPTWAGGGGIVELSSGFLRMFLENGRGSVYYADADRNSEDKFQFQTPVGTNTVSTEDARVSAIAYSKNIDGQKAILGAFPTGMQYTGGMIAVYQRDEENSTDSTHPTLRKIDEYAIDSTYFSSACLDEMNYGNNAALIYQSGVETVRFQNIQIWDILKTSGSYVEGLEYDLQLGSGGEPYERTYHIVGDKNIQAEDPAAPQVDGQPLVDVTFDRGNTVTQSVPALYSAKKTNGSVLSDIFGTEPDKNIDISKAEFTILRESNEEGHEGHYSIYSEGERRYLTIDAGTTGQHFTRTLRNYVNLKKAPGTDFFVINRTLTDGKHRAIIFERQTRVANGGASYLADWSNIGAFEGGNSYTAYFMLLEKRKAGDTEGFADDLIPGYKRVTEVTPGEKYLFAVETSSDASGIFSNSEEKKIMILYPANGNQNVFKMVYKTRERTVDAQKTLTITPKEIEGSGDMTVNNITYHIRVYRQGVTVPKGGSTFVETGSAVTSAESADRNVAAAAPATRTKHLLYKYVSSANNSLAGFTQPETNMDFTNAEFEITEDENGRYLICAKGANNGSDFYLTNLTADTYFEANKVPQELTKVEGKDSFKIRRYSPDNEQRHNREAYFVYNGMVFDGLKFTNNEDQRPTYEARGDFGFEFLEKKDTPEADTDPIPGYTRAYKITSGKKYLITEYFGGTDAKPEGILVLYPLNNKTLQTKLHKADPIYGFTVTAAANAANGATTTVTVDGKTYSVTIGEACTHPEDKRRFEGVVPATCTEKGATGTEYCTVCGNVVNQSKDVDPLGHDYDEFAPDPDDLPSYNKETKETHDGHQVRTCQRCGNVDRQVYPASELIDADLAVKLAAAEAINQETLASESKTALAAAITAAKAQMTDNTQKIDAIVGLENAVKNQILLTDYNTRKAQLNTLISEKKTEAARTSYYTESSIANLSTKLNELTEDAVNAMTYAQLEAAKTELNNIQLVKSETAAKCETLQAQLNEACEKVASIIAEGNADRKYTEESWNALKNAYDAVYGKNIDELIAIGADNLAGYLADLQEELKTVPSGNPGGSSGADKTVLLSAGVSYTVGGLTYQVSGNPADKEVIITKGTNIRKVIIKPQESINGVTCKIVGVGDSAFKGMSKVKTVTLGDNVKSVGKNAFSNCKKLTTVTIGKNVTIINAKAFLGCKKLKKVILKGNVLTSVKKQAFKNTAKKVTVKWPKGLKGKEKNKLKKTLKKGGLK